MQVLGTSLLALPLALGLTFAQLDAPEAQAPTPTMLLVDDETSPEVNCDELCEQLSAAQADLAAKETAFEQAVADALGKLWALNVANAREAAAAAALAAAQANTDTVCGEDPNSQACQDALDAGNAVRGAHNTARLAAQRAQGAYDAAVTASLAAQAARDAAQQLVDDLEEQIAENCPDGCGDDDGGDGWVQ